jgi:hypothetical protein
LVWSSLSSSSPSQTPTWTTLTCGSILWRSIWAFRASLSTRYCSRYWTNKKVSFCRRCEQNFQREELDTRNTKGGSCSIRNLFWFVKRKISSIFFIQRYRYCDFEKKSFNCTELVAKCKIIIRKLQKFLNGCKR